MSKETAEAWAKWGIAHPNWKPNPKLHRPKYVMNREEAVEKVEFACSMPVIPSANDGLLKISDLEPPPPIIDLSRMNPTQITLPDEAPPEVAEITPDTWPQLGPFVPPILSPVPIPPPPSPLPEPSSLLLVGSGLVCMLLLRGKLFRAVGKTA